jgi:hypothetical protein
MLHLFPARGPPRHQMPVHPALLSLYQETGRLLAAYDDGDVAGCVALWPAAAQPLVAMAPAVPSSSILPVLRFLPIALAAAPDFSQALCASLQAAAASLAWRQSYSATTADPAFLERYGWCELIGPRGVQLHERLACGFLLLGPDTCYPAHRHEAEEFYLPLSGTADWQQSGRPWQSRQPGVPIRHARGEPHAMRTDAAPLLALYLWRGSGLDASARLDS